MSAKVKKLLFTPVVTVAMFTAAMGMQPASFFLWYQPVEPKGNRCIKVAEQDFSLS